MCRRVIAILLSVLAFSGCSVKVDRSECPCLLYLTVAGGEDATLTLTLTSNNPVSVQTLTLHRQGEEAKAALEIQQNKEYSLLISSGNQLEEDGIIPLGSQMSELYLSYETLNCTGDVYELKSTLHKQFSRLYVNLSGIQGRMCVKSNVCGWIYQKNEAVNGRFECFPPEITRGFYKVLLPRQTDSSLILEFYDEVSSIPYFVFPLGKKLEQLGVDWQKEDLEDIWIELEYYDNGINVNVETWQQIEL